ncbi:MAG TPA: fatty acid--CoA ligase family protein [Verrucomicrobiae bacterium]|jgi:acyl-coenzyme A synthetase/AMP-(fatty) acid ligase|nr:fatty acid--CoA ligase family protein [Verrucomicrobiae bacterium]
MLYAAWQEIVRSRPNELALADLGSGERWTFRQLAEAVQAAETAVCPSGHGSAFILQTLAAWRSGQPVCALEPGQAAPLINGLPAGCIHVKISSGSAGAPRLIAFTAEQLQADARQIVATMGLRPDWPNLGVISLAHSYGFSNLVLPLLLHGIPLILLPSRLPEAVRQAGAQFPNLTLPAVPALWRVWRDAGAIPGSARRAISAGAMLPLDLESAIFDRYGLKVHNFYGASECGGISYDATDTPRAAESDAGAALHGVTLATDGESRLIVRSAAVGQTYWPAPEPALRDGIFRAGDRAEVRDGRVFLLGRHGDVINIAGQKVAPETIEQALRQHPGVRECVVFGAAERGSARAEAIVACVAGGPDLNESSLSSFARAALPAWQVPRHWWLVPALADDTRGKISRAQWRERFNARNAATAGG